MSRSPYPLQWPEGWPRTPPGRRGVPKFRGAFAQHRDSVVRQLRRRGGQVVITSNLPVRADGLPYANATCEDPGISVWWVERGRERVIACDRWRHVALNLRAIDLSLEALRGLDRWGASEMVERAFAGFAALPPGADASPAVPIVRSWREVLNMVAMTGLEPADQLAIAKARHRALIRDAHPDAGGDSAAAAALNAALAAAESELAPTRPTE